MKKVLFTLLCLATSQPSNTMENNIIENGKKVLQLFDAVNRCMKTPGYVSPEKNSLNSLIINRHIKEEYAQNICLIKNHCLTRNQKRQRFDTPYTQLLEQFENAQKEFEQLSRYTEKSASLESLHAIKELDELTNNLEWLTKQYSLYNSLIDIGNEYLRVGCYSDASSMIKTMKTERENNVSEINGILDSLSDQDELYKKELLGLLDKFGSFRNF